MRFAYSTNGQGIYAVDMHEGTERLVRNLRSKYPNVLAVGEMPYDALHAFLPVYHAGGSPRWQSRCVFRFDVPAPGNPPDFIV